MDIILVDIVRRVRRLFIRLRKILKQFPIDINCLLIIADVLVDFPYPVLCPAAVVVIIGSVIRNFLIRRNGMGSILIRISNLPDVNLRVRRVLVARIPVDGCLQLRDSLVISAQFLIRPTDVEVRILSDRRVWIDIDDFLIAANRLLVFPFGEVGLRNAETGKRC